MGKYNHVSKHAQKDPGSEDRSWVLRNINGGYYKASEHSRWVITTNLRDATKFTKEKASNIIRYCMPKDAMSKWDVINLHTLSAGTLTLEDKIEREEKAKREAKIQSHKSSDIDLNGLVPERFQDGTFNWLRYATDLVDVKNDLVKYQSALIRLEEKNHDEEMDLFHKIELGRAANVVEGYRLYKQLREVLITRRKIKNDLRRVEAMLSSQDLFLSGDVIRTLNQIENQKYNPRALPELFENEEGITNEKNG